MILFSLKNDYFYFRTESNAEPMFLRKLFASDKKLGWVIIDLFVVIIGVYCAFLIQNSATAQQDKKEQTKIYSALKMELEAVPGWVSTVCAIQYRIS